MQQNDAQHQGEGDCFSAAAHLALSLSGRNTLLFHGSVPIPDGMTLDPASVRLCHGRVTGTGGDAKGRVYPHAWVEADLCVDADHPHMSARFCIDVANGNNAVVPQALYYHIGAIEPDGVFAYTQALAQRLLVTHKHYGPWHEHCAPDNKRTTPSL